MGHDHVVTEEHRFLRIGGNFAQVLLQLGACVVQAVAEEAVGACMFLFIFIGKAERFALCKTFAKSGAVSGYRPGRMSPNWPVSALVFMAYNTLGMITMAGSCAVNAKDSRNAYSGAVLGTLCLGGLTILLLRALLTDMAFSSSLDLPMLGFSARISPVLNIIYAVVLYGAVYSTGASTYYGFSTRLAEGKVKKFIIVFGAAAGFLLGLTGFKRLVEFLYPAQGYIGILFIFLIIINFFRELRQKNN